MASVFDDCCGIIKLRIGCFIIGYLNLMSSLYLLVHSVLGIIKGKGLMQVTVSTYQSFIRTMGKHMVIMYSVILVASILELIFTILLLVGIHKNRRSFVKFHLIFNLIFLFLYVIGFILYLTTGEMSFVRLILDLITIGLTAYFLLVIRSYYVEMGKEATPDKLCETS